MKPCGLTFADFGPLMISQNIHRPVKVQKLDLNDCIDAVNSHLLTEYLSDVLQAYPSNAYMGTAESHILYALGSICITYLRRLVNQVSNTPGFITAQLVGLAKFYGSIAYQTSVVASTQIGAKSTVPTTSATYYDRIFRAAILHSMGVSNPTGALSDLIGVNTLQFLTGGYLVSAVNPTTATLLLNNFLIPPTGVSLIPHPDDSQGFFTRLLRSTDAKITLPETSVIAAQRMIIEMTLSYIHATIPSRQGQEAHLLRADLHNLLEAYILYLTIAHPDVRGQIFPQLSSVGSDLSMISSVMVRCGVLASYFLRSSSAFTALALAIGDKYLQSYLTLISKLMSTTEIDILSVVFKIKDTDFFERVPNAIKSLSSLDPLKNLFDERKSMVDTFVRYFHDDDAVLAPPHLVGQQLQITAALRDYFRKTTGIQNLDLNSWQPTTLLPHLPGYPSFSNYDYYDVSNNILGHVDHNAWTLHLTLYERLYSWARDFLYMVEPLKDWYEAPHFKDVSIFGQSVSFAPVRNLPKLPSKQGFMEGSAYELSFRSLVATHPLGTQETPFQQSTHSRWIHRFAPLIGKSFIDYTLTTHTINVNSAQNVCFPFRKGAEVLVPSTSFYGYHFLPTRFGENTYHLRFTATTPELMEQMIILNSTLHSTDSERLTAESYPMTLAFLLADVRRSSAGDPILTLLSPSFHIMVRHENNTYHMLPVNWFTYGIPHRSLQARHRNVNYSSNDVINDSAGNVTIRRWKYYPYIKNETLYPLTTLSTKRGLMGEMVYGKVIRTWITNLKGTFYAMRHTPKWTRPVLSSHYLNQLPDDEKPNWSEIYMQITRAFNDLVITFSDPQYYTEEVSSYYEILSPLPSWLIRNQAIIPTMGSQASFWSLRHYLGYSLNRLAIREYRHKPVLGMVIDPSQFDQTVLQPVFDEGKLTLTQDSTFKNDVYSILSEINIHHTLTDRQQSNNVEAHSPISTISTTLINPQPSNILQQLQEAEHTRSTTPTVDESDPAVNPIQP